MKKIITQKKLCVELNSLKIKFIIVSTDYHCHLTFGEMILTPESIFSKDYIFQDSAVDVEKSRAKEIGVIKGKVELFEIDYSRVQGLIVK